MPLPPLRWKPSPNVSARTARVDLLVLHDCEGSYQGSIAYFETRESQVSAHFVCREDGGEVTQMVDLADKAWHACAFNSRSVGWEMAGYAKNGFSDALLDATAASFAYLAHHLQIPVRHARGGVGPGIESHWGLGATGGGHSDPSRDPGFMDAFVARVQAHTDRGDFPALWSPENVPTPCPLTPPEGGGGTSAAPLDLSTPKGLLAALEALKLPNPVKLFQAANGLAVDGDPGPLTRAAILKALSGG
jgi:hypothetical protein